MLTIITALFWLSCDSLKLSKEEKNGKSLYINRKRNEIYDPVHDLMARKEFLADYNRVLSYIPTFLPHL